LPFLLYPIQKWKRLGLSQLAGLAFCLILAGMIFRENRFVGYGFMGAGVVLAITDAIIKMPK